MTHGKSHFRPAPVIGKERKDITGSFQPNGASTSVQNVYGRGFTVAHTAGANTYTVTLQDKFFGFDSCWVQVWPTLMLAQITAEPDVKTTQTIVIGHLQRGWRGGQRSTFNANTRINFAIRAVNTSGNW